MDQKYQVFYCPCISIINLWGRLTIIRPTTRSYHLKYDNYLLVYVYSSKVDDFILAKSQQIKLTYDDGDDMDNMLNGTA